MVVIAATSLMAVSLPTTVGSALDSVLGATPAAAANPALSCAAGTAYNVTAGGSFYAVNTATGANTAAAPPTIGSGESSVNALAITANGQTAYTADNDVSGGTTSIDIENITNGHVHPRCRACRRRTSRAATSSPAASTR